MEVREKINASCGFFYHVKKNLASAQTPYQKIDLVETEAYGNVMLLDGRTQVSERWEYRYHEPLVHPVMLVSPCPKRVLLIGGGDGGALREILKYTTVKSVDFVDLDSEVVTFSKNYLASIHDNSFADPRVSFHFGDGRAFVERSGSTYDVIIMDMTDPEGPASLLYTKEFFSAVKKLLKEPGSCFAMHGESPVAWPEAFACIGATLSAVFSHVSTAVCFVPMYGTLWSFRYASDFAVPKLSGADLVEKRQTERLKKPPLLVNKTMWPALFAEDPVIAEAERHPSGRIICDADSRFPGSFGG